MSFRATFIFGPLSGPTHDRNMMARRVPRALFFAPMDAGSQPHTHDGWMLVGSDQSPPGPWKGRCEYRLDEELTARTGLVHLDDKPADWQPGAHEGVAVYKWVLDPAWIEQLDD